ncbi:MAG TPA: MBL fold metallo-hydrolase [Candidatus Paceibacterota bacterium]|nr:MBL fold metallo-hydrolase [Candidatus Paceibacterota bacterium]
MSSGDTYEPFDRSTGTSYSVSTSLNSKCYNNPMESRAKITFYGGAGSVTGANFLLDTGSAKILIDCGALEREHVCDEENTKSFAYDPSSVDALIITHAHQDHIGRVPKLVHDGFKGIIYSTAATKDLAALMFEDAVRIMHTEAERHGCPIMYEKEDYERALSLWKTHEYHEVFEIPEIKPQKVEMRHTTVTGGLTAGILIELLDAGHILGSAMVKLSRAASAQASAAQNRTIIFTGDLGNSPEPLLNDTESPESANYLVMESVYGDRVHEDRVERLNILKGAIQSAIERKGTLLIPSFSLERTQILLFELKKMFENGEIAPISVFLDSPLAESATDIYRKYVSLMNPEAQKQFEDGHDAFSFQGLNVVMNSEHSRMIHDEPDPKVIIAGAGMSSGGRIRSHERRYLSDKNASVLFVGYQAPGSLGRRIEEGQKSVEIDGQKVTVRASISALSGYSGHKDRDGLLLFAEQAGESLEEVFVVMGEPSTELFLAQRIGDFLGVDARVPTTGQSAEIDF